MKIRTAFLAAVLAVTATLPAGAERPADRVGAPTPAPEEAPAWSRAHDAPEDAGYHLVVEIEDPEGHLWKTYEPAFPTMQEAFAQALKIHRSGYCFEEFDPPIPDPLLVARCYPPGKIVKTRVLYIPF
jgi:hypothetical protein